MAQHVIIVGAGPAGLSLARALADGAPRVTLVERAPFAAIADPAPDGREIALTHRSMRTLAGLGVWPAIPPQDIHPLRQARVLNGRSPFALSIAPEGGAEAPLGALVSNHLIRRALFRAVEEQANLDIRANATVTHVRAGPAGVEVELAEGGRLTGDLLVAADSRMSAVRAKLGIGADIQPVGRTMLLCRVRHERPHDGIATEWFDHDQTVAMLPLAPGRSSVVLTLPEDRAREIADLPPERLGAALAERTGLRWGMMEAESPVFAYPLVMTYAWRFAGARAALVGDAAVGMHPVTAHGFNFGLMGATRLGALIARAADVGDHRLLARYAVAHRAATWPLYQATRMLVGLFTDDRPLARIARRTTLRVGALPPVRRAMGSLLMHRSPSRGSRS